MGTSALVDVDKHPPAKPRKKREKIDLIEVPPSEEWFVQTTDVSGQPIWFIRFQATGLRTRRYGPFATKHRALLFLDRLLDLIGDGLMESANRLDEYQIPARLYGHRGAHYPVIEDEVIEATNMPLVAKRGR